MSRTTTLKPYPSGKIYKKNIDENKYSLVDDVDFARHLHCEKVLFAGDPRNTDAEEAAILVAKQSVLDNLGKSAPAADRAALEAYLHDPNETAYFMAIKDKGRKQITVVHKNAPFKSRTVKYTGGSHLDGTLCYMPVNNAASMKTITSIQQCIAAALGRPITAALSTTPSASSSEVKNHTISIASIN